MPSSRLPPLANGLLDTRAILVLSQDVVAAALLGALVETLGYSVSFTQPSEAPVESFRRSRARVALIDCEDPVAFSDDTLGRAAMLRICVAIFGTSDALARIRGLSLEHDFETLLMPPDVAVLEELLDRALERS